jgi:hypothetical protein
MAAQMKAKADQQKAMMDVQAHAQKKKIDVAADAQMQQNQARINIAEEQAKLQAEGLARMQSALPGVVPQ